MIRISIMLVILLVLSVTSLFYGVSNVSLSGLLANDPDHWLVFTVSRIPRLISVLLTGAGLSICGLIMQQIANNKFVSPTTAGTMSSAKLGIIISMIFFPTASLLVKASFAVVITIIGSFVFIKLLRSLKLSDIIFVPLVGLMFGHIVDATTDFFAYKFNLLQNISAWTQGNFALVIKDRYEILYITIPLLLLAYVYAHRFAIVGLGQDNAVSLGVDYNKVMAVGLVIVSTVTALVVVIAGNIPFIGLIVPNIVSMYLGDNLKHTLTYVALCGMIFVLACDILARALIFPFEITISTIVGAIGSVVFLFLIYRRYRHG